MSRRHITLIAIVLALAPSSVWAQESNPLVGAWERFSLSGPNGAPNPDAPIARVIFSADGYFSQIAIPGQRSKVGKAVNDMTREELVSTFNGVAARWGTYTISGNKLTRTDQVHTDPGVQGSVSDQTFRIEGDTLILTGTLNNSKSESRFRRLKKQ